MRNSQRQKCLEILASTDKWLHAYDFMQYGNIFIGHKAPARISECGKLYPFLVEVTNDPNKPKMHLYRFRWEKMSEAMDELKNLDLEAYKMLRDVLKVKGTIWEEKKIVPEFLENGSVRLVEKIVRA